MKFGVHVSIKGSIAYAVERAMAIECNTFQIFTRNPRGWNVKELNDNTIVLFKEKISKYLLEPVFAHTPYLVNLASSDNLLWGKSIDLIIQELIRCEILGIQYLITHPGSLKNQDKGFGIKKMIKALNQIFNHYNGSTQLLIENVAGNYNKSLGANLKDIYEIINSSKYSEKIGLCFDTCHAFASGYDLRKSSIIDNLIKCIKDEIGIKKLNCIHSNDSLFDLGEGKDRHEHIGLGMIGDKGFLNLIRNNVLNRVPFICETPMDNRRSDQDNLMHLKKLARGCLHQANTS